MGGWWGKGLSLLNTDGCKRGFVYEDGQVNGPEVVEKQSVSLVVQDVKIFLRRERRSGGERVGIPRDLYGEIYQTKLNNKMCFPFPAANPAVGREGELFVELGGSAGEILRINCGPILMKIIRRSWKNKNVTTCEGAMV